MSASPFIFVAFLFFASIGAVAISSEFPNGDRLGQGLALFFIIMAVWAAGLLLQPSQTL
jgi:hypothetical protein